jgi:alpha-D-ribose 1-methylphosphonate 5-triphosphate synthase subunit PhnG
MSNQTIERSTLGACLLAADRDQVLSAARLAAEGLNVSPLQPAESGLALMQWRDAVMHQPFYLGEVPIARAAVALTDAQGRRVEGGAIVMVDDAELAHALAVLDAVWAHRLPGAETVNALAESGARSRAVLRAERQAMLKRTRVNFALLSETDDEDAQ